MSEKLQQDHYKVKPKDISKHPMDINRVDSEGAVAALSTPYIAGRGAQFNYKNKFLKNEKIKEHAEGIDDWEEALLPTQYLEMDSKTIVNKVESKDVGMSYSMNPYAGCEHGCIYCYARNVHEYWVTAPDWILNKRYW